MKNLIAICITCLVFLTPAMAQMDISILPQTSNPLSGIWGRPAGVVLPPFTSQQLASLDYNDSKNGHMPAIARNIAANINLNNAGTWNTLPNGDRIWRVQITGARALALIPLFNKLYLPKGSYMHVYTVDKQEVLGAFTNDNTPEPTAFCPGLVHGESCIVEYYEPYGQKNAGIVNINNVGYAYRDISPLSNNMKSGSQSCEVNVVCSEGDKWRNQIRSVVRILVVDDDGSEGWCSGALVNNVRKDCTPYILSAEHCTENGVTGNTFNSWVFYFNYQATTCTDSVGPQSLTVNGCKKMADSEDGGGNSGSDFLLLQLNHAPPATYNVYYSGWNISNTTPPSGVGIHHPNADVKKISTYSAPAVSTAWGNIAQNTHWQVLWTPTTNGHGITEPGSSGSPLYSDIDTLIVGHLTGGGSCCVSGTCGTFGQGPNSPDLYGKLAYDWTNDGVTDNVQLKPWLDPDNTGTTVLHGLNAPCGSSLTNDGGIQAVNEPEGNVCATTVSPVIAMRNFGSNTLTAMTISYRFDNSSLTTYSWTGTLLAGASVDVTLPTATLSSGQHTFLAISSKPNNVTDVNFANDTARSSFYLSGVSGSLNLALTTDDDGSKTTWQVTDAANNVVASGGPYPDLKGGTTYNIPFCLPIACYTFTIFSSTGNGMTTNEDGNFILSGNAGTTTYASLNTPAFGSQEVHTFCIEATGIAEIPVFAFSVIPNPSTGLFNVTIGNSDIKNVRVYDVTGKVVFEKRTAEQNIALDLSAESKGVYILQVETSNGKAVQKLVLK